MSGRQRTVQVKYRVTEERALIEEKMKLVPTRNMAADLRKIAIDGYIIQVDHSDIIQHEVNDLVQPTRSTISSSLHGQ